MALVNHSVTNLINGVSQQASSVRLDNQVEEQVNCFSDVTNGLTIRNGIELVNVVDTNLENRIPIEFTVGGEKFLLGMDTSDTGNELIHVPLSADVTQLAASITDVDYFKGASRQDIRIVEDKERVYILNKNKTVGTNESDSAYYDIIVRSDSSGLPASDWTSGSYSLTITSVQDDASSITPSASPLTITIDASMSPKDISDLINADTALIAEVGTVETVGVKGNYRLYFKDIPSDFVTPDVTMTTIASIAGSSVAVEYTPNDTSPWTDSYAYAVTGSFIYQRNSWYCSYSSITGNTNFVFSLQYPDTDVVFSVSGNKDSAVGPDGWTYYRGSLELSTSSSKLYSIRREKSITTTDSYTPTLSTPVSLTGDLYSNDKFSDKGMIWVTGVASEQTYDVTINYEDTAGASYTLPLTTVNVGSTPTSNIKLNWVAEQIRSAIDASSHFTSTTSDIYNNAVYFYSSNSGEYYITSIKVENNFDTTSISAVARATINNDSGITDTSTLPPSFKDGFKVRVGNDNSEGTNYYLYYDEDFQGWKESGLDETRALDPNTMPYIIEKETILVDNIIELKPNDWKKSSAGDRESNESPSFVGRSINDIFFYGSRLGVATDDTLVMSSIGEPDEFFRTTCSQVISSDRVDIQLDNSRIGFSAISNVISYDGKLFVNTGFTQSVLLVNTSFDLTSARLTEVSSYTLGDFPPLPVNNGLYFALSNNGRTNIYNYLTAGNSTYEAQNITKHVPYYLEGNIKTMAYADNMTVIQTEEDKKILYVQNRYSVGGEMLQNAWHKWEIPYDVEYFYFYENNLFLMVSVTDDDDNEKTFICKYDITPQVINADTEDTYIGWVPYLDFYTRDKTLIEDFSDFIGINSNFGIRFDSVQEAYDSTLVDQSTLGTQDGPHYSRVSAEYYWQVDNNTNKVVFNDGAEIVTGNTDQAYFDYDGYRYERGEESSDSGYYYVSRYEITESSYYTDDILYGVPFKASVQLSEIVPRQQAADGSYTVMNYATLMLRRMRLYLGNTGVFKVNISFDDRQDYTVSYTGQPLGKMTLGRASVSDINFKFPINGKSDKITILIESDSAMPFNLLSAEWQGKLTQRGRNI